MTELRWRLWEAAQVVRKWWPLWLILAVFVLALAYDAASGLNIGGWSHVH